MAVWHFYLCLLLTLSASVEIHSQPVRNKSCGACWTGWSAFGCRCFKFFSNSQTWINAEKICQDFDGHLASIHSHVEYVFIQNLIRYTTNQATKAWIGGHDAVHQMATGMIGNVMNRRLLCV
uniref:C-type lectin domain-containing protein n=1 Tax=Cyprinus carpio TaxID=7962 RepID=A0A8C2C835_CYPCA